jgi:NAD(P)-dependent dehydrogenase (short-subunit alcohol dehydrogenase family)
MQSNEPCFLDFSRGSIVLVASTSGYFGSSGVGAYVASKHGLVGLLRSSQLTSRAMNVKVNAVAPFFTPTPTFSKLSGKWAASGLRANTLEDVGNAIAHTCLAPGSGRCLLVKQTFFSFDKPSFANAGQIAGGIMKEVEEARTELIPCWLGEEMAECLQTAGRLFAEEGYPLPEGEIDSPMACPL